MNRRRISFGPGAASLLLVVIVLVLSLLSLLTLTCARNDLALSRRSAQTGEQTAEVRPGRALPGAAGGRAVRLRREGGDGRGLSRPRRRRVARGHGSGGPRGHLDRGERGPGIVLPGRIGRERRASAHDLARPPAGGDRRRGLDGRDL